MRRRAREIVAAVGCPFMVVDGDFDISCGGCHVCQIDLAIRDGQL